MSIFKDFVQNKETLTDRLLKEVSDYDIYCELVGIEFELGKSVISPLREDDEVPSFSLFIPTKKQNLRPEELWWRDFRDGSGDVFKFAREYAKFVYGLSLNTRYEIIKFIDFELDLGILSKESKKPYVKRNIDYDKVRESKEILFKSREYTLRDLIWWAVYGVDAQLLKEHDIRSIRYLLDENFNIRTKISIYDLAFAFVVYDKIKVYRPEVLANKWRNTCPAEYIQGWQQLRGSDTLIITKSYKDLLVFKSFMNVDVVAPQSESGSFTEEHIDYIKTNYQRVYVVYDYDEAGKIGAHKLEDNHDFTVRWVSTLVDTALGKPVDKDISDYIYNHGYLSGLNRMKKMFHELDDSYFRDDRVDYFSDLIIQLTNVA